MLTNNFYQTIRACVVGGMVNSVLKSTTNSTENCFGSNACAGNLFIPFYNNLRTVLTTPTYSEGMAFGTGNVPPSLDDYWLSGDLITTVKILLCEVASTEVDGVARNTNAITVQNTSATDTVVINEMGFVSRLYIKANSTAYCLVDRTVLDTPLTLAPGEQGVITYTFTLNLPIVQ